MSDLVADEDWESLQNLLAHGIKLLDGKQVESVKLAILEFYSTASMLGLEDIAGVAKKFEEFLLNKVAPGWGDEATATLSFSMGGLLEKMQLNQYSPAFSQGLGEILMFMDFYEEDEPGQSAPPEVEAPSAPPMEAPAVKAVAVSEPPAPEAFAEVSPEHESPAPAERTREAGPQPASAPKADFPAVEPEPAHPAVSSGLPGVRRPAEAGNIPRIAPAGLEKGAGPGYKYPTGPQSRAVPLEGPSADAVGYVMDALDWYREILEEDPASRAFVPLAEELCNRGLWQEAADVCRRGLVRHPFDLRAMVLLGWSLLRLGDVDQAQTVLGAARTELEKSAVLYGALAEIAEAAGDADSAKHLGDIFESLQSGEQRHAWNRRSFISFEPDFQARSSPASADARETGRGGASAVLEVMSALLEGFEDKPSRPIPCGEFFSASDRVALKAILYGGEN
ncbi:MAG: hypothetical protein ABFD98_00735 [Syntrophobacteraceae bacterium]|nr:hypothetical protein [Desulfobacteraceae bacterium]